MTLAGGNDFRPGKTTDDKVLDSVRKLLARNINVKDRKQAYDMLDSLGNVRLDRLAMAGQFDDNGRLKDFAVRISGIADSKRLADLIMLESKGRARVEKKKGPGGEAVTLIRFPKDGELIALIDDTDVLVVGGEKPLELLNMVLRLKGERKDSFVDGPQSRLLKYAPAQARLVVAGELPEAARKELTGKKSPLRAVPKQFVLHGTQTDRMNLELAGELKSKQEAQDFVDRVLGLKQMALKELDNVPAEAKVPAEMLKGAREMLNALKVETDSATAKVKASLDSGAILGSVFLWLFKAEQAPLPDR
jgi:hypothetical protein